MPRRSCIFEALPLLVALWLAPVSISNAQQPYTSPYGSPLRDSQKAVPPAKSTEVAASHFSKTLYGHDEERPGVRIGWYFDNAVEAFRTAIDRNVPLVLVVGEDTCVYCQYLVDALTCPSVNRYAGSAVFAISSPSRDVGASTIASSLKIESNPAVTVLMPETRILVEGGRINGYFPGDHLAGLLDTFRRQYPEEAARADPERGVPGFAGRWDLQPFSQATAVITPLSKTPEHPARCAN